MINTLPYYIEQYNLHKAWPVDLVLFDMYNSYRTGAYDKIKAVPENKTYIQNDGTWGYVKDFHTEEMEQSVAAMAKIVAYYNGPYEEARRDMSAYEFFKRVKKAEKE